MVRVGLIILRIVLSVAIFIGFFIFWAFVLFPMNLPYFVYALSLLAVIWVTYLIVYSNLSKTERRIIVFFCILACILIGVFFQDCSNILLTILPADVLNVGVGMLLIVIIFFFGIMGLAPLIFDNSPNSQENVEDTKK